MYDLSACNRGLLKSYHCYVLFLPFKNPANVMKSVSNSIFIYSWKKSPSQQITETLFLNAKSLFFDVLKNGQIFASKVSHFQYDNRFLFSREMGTISSWKEVTLQTIYVARIVFVLTLFRLLKVEESFGESSSFPFSKLQILVLKTFKISYLVLCHSFMLESLVDWKHIKRYIFHYFL